MTGAAAHVAAVLERHLGLSPGSVGGRAIEAAVRHRAAATGAADEAAYVALLADPAELEALVEAVVVPETWFFRYPESFRHLAAWAAGYRAEHPGRPLRVLSAPCSTGEEPYSIAVALLDAGLPPGSFHVDALDVSRRAVEAARRGAYPATAFREGQPDPRERHFDRAGELFAVGHEVRSAVAFRTGNLVDPFFLAAEPPFDAVFCRNLFIYLTPDARRRVADTLDRLLAPGGAVYTGHAEPLGLMDGRFRPTGRPQAFAFERAKARPALVLTVPPSEVVVTKPAFLPSPLAGEGPGVRGQAPRVLGNITAADSPLPLTPNPSPARGEGDQTPALLAAARAAADRGDPLEAAALCEQALRDAGPSADGFALLGVAHAMAGDRAGAERAFTRALYLDPGHYDALVHMMVLAENRGDAAAAANYRRRADRAAGRGVRP